MTPSPSLKGAKSDHEDHCDGISSFSLQTMFHSGESLRLNQNHFVCFLPISSRAQASICESFYVRRRLTFWAYKIAQILCYNPTSGSNPLDIICDCHNTLSYFHYFPVQLG